MPGNLHPCERAVTLPLTRIDREKMVAYVLEVSSHLQTVGHPLRYLDPVRSITGGLLGLNDPTWAAEERAAAMKDS